MAVFMYIVVSMIAVNHVLGASLSISGSSSYAVLNRPFTVTCTVTQASSLIDKVLFITRASTDAFASLRQNMASCSVFNAAPSGYTVSCGSGTGSSLSTTKTYSLMINRAAEHDAKDWWCDLSTAKTRSNTFSLQFSSGPDSVTLSPPSPRSVAEGDSMTVMCAASCNPPCSYSWTLKNQQISLTSRLTLTNINRSQTWNVYMCTATNSFLSTSKSKQFTLTVYCYWCPSYGSDMGSPSQIVTLPIDVNGVWSVRSGVFVAGHVSCFQMSPYSLWTSNVNATMRFHDRFGGGSVMDANVRAHCARIVNAHLQQHNIYRMP
ncbi:uncharacterized protein LOC121386067 [Gigantopelta aegis]|uniref:uncharacterized protein LOC121386067 n=1 Tax=Gigantopelta aegis TaxID=1735272 RepID=UPI001B88A7E0|nr:uncharacterized protein LOC121386067 [Gigantopelta aegis]